MTEVRGVPVPNSRACCVECVSPFGPPVLSVSFALSPCPLWLCPSYGHAVCGEHCNASLPTCSRRSLSPPLDVRGGCKSPVEARLEATARFGVPRGCRLTTPCRDACRTSSALVCGYRLCVWRRSGPPPFVVFVWCVCVCGIGGVCR